MFRKCKIMSYCLIEKPPPGGLYNVERIQFVASANTMYFSKYFCVFAIKKVNDACYCFCLGIVFGMLDLYNILYCIFR
jgi:hypothetical protein